MEVVREAVSMSHKVLEKSIECNVESNVIVPDKNPDILKVLQVDTTATITKKILKEGRLTVEGKVYADVIYLADNDESSVKTLPAVVEFTDFFDLALLQTGMYTSVSCDVEQAELTLVNSRKVNLRATIGINAEAIADSECNYIAMVNGDDAAFRCEEVEGYRLAVDDNIEFLIKEETELVSGSMPVCDIIKCDASITDKEIRISGTKAIVKGAVTACVLYTDTDGKIEMTNARFPFTEVFELCEEIDENMLDVFVGIIDKACNVGGERSIRYEFTVRIELSAKKTTSVRVMSDCYFYGCNTVCDCEEVRFESVKKLPRAARSVREIVMTDEHMPKISAVYNVIAKPRILSSEKTGNSASVNIVLDVSILYLSEERENPICCLKAALPLVHNADVKDGCDLSLAAECEHISYALTGGGVEIRATVAISAEEKRNCSCKIIKDIERGEEERSNEIVIFFASGDDDVWDIAKKYRVSCDAIAELNEIDKDKKPEKGKKLIIPI